MNLETLGWSAHWRAQLDRTNAAWFGRIMQPNGQFHLLAMAHETRTGVAVGNLKNSELAVGDWVYGCAEPDPNPHCLLPIEGLLKRRSAITRFRPGPTSDSQILATNVDWVWIATSMNRDFNPRRLERYLAMAWPSGATPVILLTKSDACGDPEPYFSQTSQVAPGVDVIAISSHDGTGIGGLRSMLAGGHTAVLLGSSGVGKSTLVNRILNSQQQATSAIRETDHKGRHTTSRRDLILVEPYGVIIDTPGLREVAPGIASDDLGLAFGDIQALAQSCRFGDCSHGSEPGCSVSAALEEGQIDRDRLKSFLALRAELKFQESRVDQRARQARKQNDKMLARAIRSMKKDR